MKRHIRDVLQWAQERTQARRERALQRAAREMMRGDDTHGGGIWKSGKGGSHPG